MLAAILCSSLVMTSCSNDDNAATAESAEMAKALDYSSTKLYNTVGMKLVDAVIKQNRKWWQAPFLGESAARGD